MTKLVTLCTEGPSGLQLQHYCRITETSFAVVTGKSTGTCGAHAWVKQRHMRKMMCGACGPVSGANKQRESGAQRGLGWESSWMPTKGVSPLHFAALTRRIWTSRGNAFNDRSASVFQHCVGGWSNGAGQGRRSDLRRRKWMFLQNNKHFPVRHSRKRIRLGHVMYLYNDFCSGLFAQRKRLVL